MIAVRNILLSGQTGPNLDAAALSTFFTPEIRADAAQEVLYRVVVEGTMGSPTSAVLKVAFQVGQRTSAGNTGVGDPYTDAAPIWTTIDANSQAGLLPDGDWPTRIARHDSSFPVTFVRRIRGGSSNRLAITPSLGGGTSPGIIMTVECEVRY